MGTELKTIETEAPEPRSRMGRALDALSEQFGDLAGHLDNPFVARQIRIETRKGRPLLTISGPALITLAAYLALFYFFGPHDGRPAGTPWIPFGKMLVLAAGTVYGYAVMISAISRSNRIFTNEAIWNTLEQVLILPMRYPELLLKVAIYPFMMGMLVALSGLPFLLIAYSAGGLSLLDLFSLYVFYAFMSFSPPVWSYVMISMAKSKSAGPLTKDAKKRSSAGVVWAIALQVFIQVGMRVFNKPIGWIAMKAWGIAQSFAASLMPSFGLPMMMLPFAGITWPALAGIALVQPIPFYWIALPLIFVIVPLHLWALYYRMIAGAKQIGVMDPEERVQHECLATPRMVIGWLRNLAIMGYLWRPLVLLGGLSWVASERHVNVSLAQAGLLFVLLGCALVASFFRMQAARISLDRENKRIVEAPTPFLPALAPLAIAFLCYLAAHIFGWLGPLPAPALAFLWKIALLAAASIPLAYGLQRLRRAVTLRSYRAYLLSDMQEPWEPTTLFYLLTRNGDLMHAASQMPIRHLRPRIYLEAAESVLVLFGPFVFLAVASPVWSHVGLLSPLGAMLALSPALRDFLSTYSPFAARMIPPWWHALVLQPVFGLILLGIAQAYASWRPVAVRKKASADGTGWFMAAQERMIARFLDWVMRRIDNPIITREIRSYARKYNLAGLLVLILVPYAMVGIIWNAPQIAQEMPGMVRFLFGDGPGSQAGIYLGPLVLILGGAVLFPIVATGAGVAMLFSLESMRSALPFLLMTPMSDRQIAGGMCFSQILPMIAIELLALPLMLLLVILSCLAGAAQTAVWLFLGCCVLMVGGTALGASAGVLLSARFRNLANAGAITTLLGVLLYLGIISVSITVGSLTGATAVFPWVFGVPMLIAGLALWPLAVRHLHIRRSSDLETEGQRFEN